MGRFIGGGYDPASSADRGRGFFVVDLATGDILWSFTKGASDTVTTSTSMTFSIPASPAVVDTDNDGFVDAAYVGDLEGISGSSNSAADGRKRLQRLQLERGQVLPVRNGPADLHHACGQHGLRHRLGFLGNRGPEQPTTKNTQDLFFALKDQNLPGARLLGICRTSPAPSSRIPTPDGT